MPIATLEQLNSDDADTQAQLDDHRFFDLRTPEQPEEVFGISTEALLQLGSAAMALRVLPYKAYVGVRALPNAVRLVPLIEEMQSGAVIGPEDIRPYRKPIKKLLWKVNLADKLAASAGALAVGVPLRRKLNNKIEREFPLHAARTIDQARELVASIEDEVAYVATFDDPKQQFVGEVQILASTVTDAIIEQRDNRVRRNKNPEPATETLIGMTGIVTKVVRKLRGFFGIFRRDKPALNTEVTAYDAAAGIESTMAKLSTQPETVQSQLPLLSKLVLSKLPETMAVSKDLLTFIAPEILNFLFSTNPEDQMNNQMLASVYRNPHELRFITSYRNIYHGYSLSSIQWASRTLLPAIRDILPNEGTKVTELLNRIQSLLQPLPRAQEQDIVDQPAIINSLRPKTIRHRFKKLYRRAT